MKHLTLRFLPLGLLAVAATVVSSCGDDTKTTWETYAEWRQANIDFFDEQKYLMTPAGENEYITITPPWNSGAQVLIKYLNDRSKTEGSLSPMLTSTVDVKYVGRLYDGTPFDSSYLNTDSIFQTSLSPNAIISGWSIALQYMRVGDSARVIIPYGLGYGASNSGVIPPYSTLVFDIKLKNIFEYEE